MNPQPISPSFTLAPPVDRACPEYGTADAYERRPFFDGDFEVVRHTHREVPQSDGVAQLAQRAEDGPHVLGIIGPRRHRHQAREIDVRQPPDSFRQLRNARWRHAKLRLFGRNIHLDEHADFAWRSGTDRLSETLRVNAVEYIKEADRDRDFVAL